MLGLAKRVGARFLLTSTSEVYGDPLQHPQVETYWGNVNPIGKKISLLNYYNYYFFNFFQSCNKNCQEAQVKAARLWSGQRTLAGRWNPVANVCVEGSREIATPRVGR